MPPSLTRPTLPALPPPLRRLLERAIDAESMELPVLPDTAMHVMQACNDESADAGRLSDILGRDQSLASHVLRIANSAAYAPKEPIVSLRQAVSRLGVASIGEIAISIAVKGRVFQVPGHQLAVRELWMHSAAAGIYAKEIARQVQGDQESAFLCGLLHDVGKPMVLLKLIDEVRARTDQPIPSLVFEAALAEFHAEVGAVMARRWGLPEWIVQAILHHHDYRQATEFAGKVMITSLADELCHWALDEDAGPASFPAELPVIQDLDLTDRDIAALLDRRGRVLAVVEAFA
ncbi:MAG: HDOD domain-containing protein [Planctomycetota bacterium]